MSSTRSDSVPLTASTIKAPSRLTPRAAAAGVLIAVLVLTAGFYGVRRIQFALNHEETDDAQIEGHISPVLPRVSGYVARVLVSDNQRVSAGDPLVEIDARDLDLKIGEADTALQNARADLGTWKAGLAAAEAAATTAADNVETARVRRLKAASDLERDGKLFQNGAITDSQLSDTRAAADTARAQLAATQGQAREADLQIAVAQARVHAAQTAIEQRTSDLDYAKLERSYASVTAPISGLVSRKSVEPGQYVQSGQTLLSIASDTDVWVVANFKETQLTRIRPAESVDFEADTYPGVVFQGRVQSVSGATGARFALLPPDNSTGNFVKVTQRVPVKIVLVQAPDADHPLRPGMSVDATIRISD